MSIAAHIVETRLVALKQIVVAGILSAFDFGAVQLGARASPQDKILSESLNLPKPLAH